MLDNVVLQLCCRQQYVVGCSKCCVKVVLQTTLCNTDCSKCCVKFVLQTTLCNTDCSKCCVKVVLQTTLCNTGCSQCKRFRGDRGAGQRPLMVLLSQLQQFTFAQFTILNSQICETQIGKCWLIHSIDNSLQYRSYQCYSQLKCQCNPKPQFPILRFDAPFHFAHKFCL